MSLIVLQCYTFVHIYGRNAFYQRPYVGLHLFWVGQLFGFHTKIKETRPTPRGGGVIIGCNKGDPWSLGPLPPSLCHRSLPALCLCLSLHPSDPFHSLRLIHCFALDQSAPSCGLAGTNGVHKKKRRNPTLGARMPLGG